MIEHRLFSKTGLHFSGRCLSRYWRTHITRAIQATSPTGTVIATSRCTLSGVACATGRQETFGYVPTAAGTCTLRAYADTGSINQGKGGSFVLDVSQGPLTGSAAPPPPPPPPPPANLAPTADAGPDATYKRSKRTNLATFTLDGSASSDPEGGVLTYAWRNASGGLVGTTARVTVTRAAGTYAFTLTVTDPGGLSASDSVTVKVIR